MKTPRLALLILCGLCVLGVMTSRAQAPAPPHDSILKQLNTQLKTDPAVARDAHQDPPEAGATRIDGRVDEYAASPFGAGTWTLAPFASYRAHELGEFNGRFGGGLAVSYAPANNIAIEVETLAEEYRSSPVVDSLEEAGVNFKGYLPFGTSGLAPYIFVGYTRNLQVDQNRMNAGAGLEVRAGRVYAFGDGRWTHDFSEPVHFLFRLGGGVHF